MSVERFSITRDSRDGKFRWILIAGNGRVIALGQIGYTTEKGCIRGIGAARRLALDAPLDER
jgi:uncharacterized protein YegP (UPF0339 family)